jgi:AraC-like DNA-binding protein
MNSTSQIRALYNPVQPTVRRTGDVCYVEFLPHVQLQPFIYCYWQLRTTQELAAPFHYRVVADGCIDIYFELSHPHENYIMGFCRRYTEFPLDSMFNYVGVRFLPAMFPQLFKINAAELSNRFTHLDAVVPQLSAFISNHFHADQKQPEIAALLNGYFLQHIAQANLDNDRRLYDALAIILKKQGVLEIEKDLNTGVSARQLRRLFAYYIGDTPKTFSKVVRFQNILKAKPSRQSLRQNTLFFDEGYFDQSHFIKEFKRFFGVTPSKAFRR